MNRREQRQQWLDDYFQGTEFQIDAASEDASFRSYYRITTASMTYILMDAPPEHEDCRPFVAVSQLLSASQVKVPELFATDYEQGFLLLSDFGNLLYLAVLVDDKQSHQSLYSTAIDSILKMQATVDANLQLPPYDHELLMTEMQLFNEWFIGKHLDLKLDTKELEILEDTFALLCQNAHEQPQAMVHRDYHSRNLMVLDKDNDPGVIDFQDAVYGPFTYDLASLLKDCYISWPAEIVEMHCRHFLQAYNDQFNTNIEFSQLMRWFELMAAQRHLKAIGIFCRLNYRDGKAGYLNDIPLTMNYLLKTAAKYPELAVFSQLLQSIQPTLTQVSAHS